MGEKYNTTEPFPDYRITIQETQHLYETFCHRFRPVSRDLRREFRRIQLTFEVGYRHASDDPVTRAGFRLGMEAVVTWRNKSCNR